MSEPDREQSPQERLDEARRTAADSALNPRTAEIEGVSDRLQTVIDAAERAAEAIRYDAEEQARSHLAEAQAKADRLTAERVGMVAQLTDDLIDHAGVVKSHSERMVAALEEAISTVHNRLDAADAADQLGAGDGAPPAATPAEGPPRPPRPPAAVESEPERIVEPLASGATVEAEVRRRTEVVTDSSAREAGGASEEQAEKPAATEAEAREVPKTPAEAGAARSGPAGGEPSKAMLLRATQLAVAGGSRDSIAAKLREEFGDDPTAALDRVLGPSG